MGIQDLGKIITAGCETVLPYSSFSGQSIAIDTPIQICKAVAVATKTYYHSVDPMSTISHERDIHPKIGEHIMKITMMFEREGILPPIWVFDGKQREEKVSTCERRKRVKSTLGQKIDDLKSSLIRCPIGSDVDKLRKYQCQTLPVKSCCFEYTKMLIASREGKILEGEYDAEELCAKLVKRGEAAAVITTDTDVLAHGAKIMIDSIVFGGFSCRFLGRMLEELELTEEQFRNLCVMLGCDFNSRMKGFGPVRCMKMIKEYHTIEKARAALPLLDWDSLNAERCLEIFS